MSNILCRLSDIPLKKQNSAAPGDKKPRGTDRLISYLLILKIPKNYIGMRWGVMPDYAFNDRIPPPGQRLFRCPYRRMPRNGSAGIFVNMDSPLRCPARPARKRR